MFIIEGTGIRKPEKVKETQILAAEDLRSRYNFENMQISRISWFPIDNIISGFYCYVTV